MKRFIKYFLVGGFAAFVDISLFTTFLYYFSIGWFWAALMSFIAATAVNYILSIRHVFESGVRFKKRHEVGLVFLVSGIGLAINQLALYLGISILGINPLVAKVGSTGVVFFWNYVARSKIIFKNVK